MDKEISTLIDTIKENGHDIEYSGPVSIESIEALEYKLKRKLPSSYKSFLTNYGSMAIYDSFISGIFGNDPFKMKGGLTYADTLFMKESFPNMPEELLVVERHEDGAYCINFELTTQESEYAIINYEFGDQNYKEPVAATFREYFIDWYLRGYAEDKA